MSHKDELKRMQDQIDALTLRLEAAEASRADAEAQAAEAIAKLTLLSTQKKEELLSLAREMKKRWVYVPWWTNFINNWLHERLEAIERIHSEVDSNYVYPESERQEDRFWAFVLINQFVPTHLKNWLDERELLQRNIVPCRNNPTNICA